MFSVATTVAAETPKRIAFIPFTANTPKDMTYLTNGIRDMLGSRLASEVGVNIIDRATIDQSLSNPAALKTAQDYRKAGELLKADYVVVGSLTALGSTLSIDSKVFNLAQGSLQSFYATAKNEDEIILAIDKLAWDISEKVFSHPRPTTALVQPQTTQPQATQSSASPYASAHPDRVLTGRTGALRGSLIITPQGATGEFSKSQNLKLDLQAMEIGDVDGDGVNEVVLADRNMVYIYKREGNRFAKVGQISILDRLKIHAISLADLNNNGKEEIYISAADHSAPYSVVAEWKKENEAEILIENAPWYLRAMEMPGEGVILTGQRAAIDGPVEPGIYRLNLSDNQITTGGQISVPAKINLFDFAVADLDGDNVNEIIAINQYDRLMVMRTGGTMLWKSDEYYGGTTRFIGGSPDFSTASTIENPEQDKRIYVPSRIIITDLDNDGQNDVLINKNLSSASRIFKNLKSYPSGELHALTWNGIALTEQWRTRKIDGYIADYKLIRQGNTAELLVGLMLRAGAAEILGPKTSTVLMYQLDMAQAENAPLTN